MLDIGLKGERHVVSCNIGEGYVIRTSFVAGENNLISF